MKKLFTLITILSLGFGSSAQKQVPKMTLASLLDSIRQVIKKEHIVGAMVGITTRDSVIFSGGFGYADLEKKRIVDSQTLFRMGSNTKMIVGLAILKLQEQGKINIYDDVKKIAPEIQFENKWEATSPLKVVHLLEHTSGFDDMKLNAMYTLDKIDKFDLRTCNQASLVCRWRPGERYAYCNPNYNLLGYLIEKITQQPYNQYLTKNILEPLRMSGSNFNLYSQNPHDTKEYVYRNGKISLVPSVTLIGGPQGALWSSADDMIKLLQMYLRNGQPIISANSLNEMETPHSSLGAKAGLKSGYGLGNFYTHFFNKVGMRGHNGLTGTCFSTCIYNREAGFGYTIASNSNYGGSKIEELIHTFLEQNLPKKQLSFQPLDTKAIEPYLGFYQFNSSRNEVATLLDKFSNGQKIYIENGILYMQGIFGDKVKLNQIAPMIFVRDGMNTPTIAFTKNADRNNVLTMAGVYFEQSSSAWAWFWRIGLTFMVVLIIVSGVVAIIELIGAFMGKVKWKQVPLRFLPITSLILFGLSATTLTEKQQFSYLLYVFREVNAETILIFIGSTFIGIAGPICLYLAIKSFLANKNRWIDWYWFITYSSVFFLAVLLFRYGMIGLRTWAM
ncbi:MAG: serine hydrolase domain-containing protein [Spirosomataceae bacterium]